MAILSDGSARADVWFEKLDASKWQSPEQCCNAEISSDDLEFWVAEQLKARGLPINTADISHASPMGKREAAKRGVAAVYPGGVPENVSNAILCRQVGSWLKNHFSELGEISDDTIERAAGRKK
jgi:hypothetical protein